MAAPQIPGTPAAPAEAAPEATAADESASDSGIDAILSSLTGQEIAGPDEKPAPEGDEASEETETPEGEPEAEPTDPAKGLDDEVIFSDKALGTKEGLLRAKARNLQLRRLNHEKYLELKKFQSRVAKRHARVEKAEPLIQNVRAALADTHSGDAERMLRGLGHLYGTDGIKALETLNTNLIHRGKSPLDPQVQAVIDSLNQKILQLEGGLNERETQARVHHLQQLEQQHLHRIGGTITQNATQLPHLARIYADDPTGTAEFIADQITAAAESGTPVDGRTYFVHLEAQLAKHFGAGAPKGDGGGPAPKQPATAQPTPAQRSPGKSIGPRSAAPSTPRQPSEEESLRALADDADLMSSLGLG